MAITSSLLNGTIGEYFVTGRQTKCLTCNGIMIEDNEIKVEDLGISYAGVAQIQTLFYLCSFIYL